MSERERANVGATGGAAARSEARILHVNDDDANRYAVTRMLQKAGFEVVEAANGSEALQLANELPDLVILDVKLPDIDGYEVAARIRANPPTRLLPVLHLSANLVGVEARARGFESGADGYLTQPVEPAELVATVRAILRARRAERELRLSLEQNSVILQNIADAVTAQDAAAASSTPTTPRCACSAYADRAPVRRAATPATLLAGFEMLDEAGGADRSGRPARPPRARRRARGAHASSAGAGAAGAGDRWTLVQSRPVRDDSGPDHARHQHPARRHRAAPRRAAHGDRSAEVSAALAASLDYDDTLRASCACSCPRSANGASCTSSRATRCAGSAAHRYVALDDQLRELRWRRCRSARATSCPSRSTPAARALQLDFDDHGLAARIDSAEATLAFTRSLGTSAVDVRAAHRARRHRRRAVGHARPTRTATATTTCACSRTSPHRAALAIDNARVFRREPHGGRDAPRSRSPSSRTI